MMALIPVFNHIYIEGVALGRRVRGRGLKTFVRIAVGTVDILEIGGEPSGTKRSLPPLTRAV